MGAKARVVAFFRGTLLPRAVEWQTGPVENQLQTPHCVGFAGWQWLMTKPQSLPLPADLNGDELYYECKVINGEPRAEDGSDSRALMKALATEGLVRSYHWAQRPGDITDWILSKGPVLFGTPWTEGMFSPNGTGRIRPTGSVAGGHEYLGHGYDPKTRLVKCCNSWGEGWGQKGHFYIHITDLWSLIVGTSGGGGGDACVASQT